MRHHVERVVEDGQLLDVAFVTTRTVGQRREEDFVAQPCEALQSVREGSWRRLGLVGVGKVVGCAVIGLPAPSAEDVVAGCHVHSQAVDVEHGRGLADAEPKADPIVRNVPVVSDHIVGPSDLEREAGAGSCVG